MTAVVLRSRRTRRFRRRGLAVGLAAAVTVGLVVAGQSSAGATDRYTERHASQTGYGGAVSSVDPEATAAGLKVLRAGGNAVDAAVAVAAALGVTEPYSAGIGGGGYFVFYDAKSGKVKTLDGRETAPASILPTAFLDPATGQPYRFTPELVTSGVSVGIPGTPATWAQALQSWGTLSLKQALNPAIDIASRGFIVDPTFRLQTLENKVRFAAFPSTAKLYLPGGDAPQVGSVFSNPDLAATYKLLGQQGVSAIYNGDVGTDIVNAVRTPPKDPATTLPIPPGSMTKQDLATYKALLQKPTVSDYHDLTIYGMAPSSSGGTTVGEALNILDQFQLWKQNPVKALHYYLDATALAFADRGAYVGDPAYVEVPQKTLLSDDFAASRACLIPADKALPTPTAAGNLSAKDCGSGQPKPSEDNGTSTTHLVTSDRWGNVVSYTLTIEQTGGSGIVVPGRGFILNNELTDFSAVYVEGDPNAIAGGKRPRSSMSPTIVLKNDRPVLALGSPGGSTIITTVLQTLVNRYDLGMPLLNAVAAPRASLRNTVSVTAEQSFIDQYGAALTPYGYTFTPAGAPGTSAAEIGAVTALQFGAGGKILAVAEPVRRGGGDAGVVYPTK